ncbi:fumarylacetoacetate hydrolase family protein [Roseomonas hellenica]|uniref:Fumarylacetoacetate hydrolase family protein n=1 Tax=Plastoroseomonas hellenica TaxID=2687306 RepID=A0ABS5EY17_9PROT|nr:fumarylacetoacetate hydrolase family protein [Plastoroseomonas hellenica]MBR0665173.1 fumarylacetoacetate hydrolase family protein [Plastoroseomonas hellenica]
MRLMSFSTPAGPSFGMVSGQGVIDLGRRLGGTLRGLLAQGVDTARSFAGEAPDHALTAVTFLPVVPDAAKIIGIGLNYRSHVSEGGAGREAPAFPRVFSRWNDTLLGHDAAMVRPRVSTHFDYEGELAVIIGKPGRHISKAAALSHVAGYACFNDGSVRDWQKHTTTSGKNFFASGPFGPWMVTADEIPDPAALTLTTRVNGQQVQRASTGDLIYDIPTLIEYVSAITPLAPGDVIATGTPEGVASYRDPPGWLKPGDVVEVEISGIGTLRNPVVAEEG